MKKNSVLFCAGSLLLFGAAAFWVLSSSTESSELREQALLEPAVESEPALADRAQPTLTAVKTTEKRSVDLADLILEDRSLDSREKALALLKVVPELPGEVERLTACEHALLLLDDEIYRPAFDMLMAADTGEALRELLMDDLIGRSPFLHLPYLVQLASRVDHPYSSDARRKLLLAVGDDYGTNWSGWSDAVASLLESSPAGVPGVELLQ